LHYKVHKESENNSEQIQGTGEEIKSSSEKEMDLD